MIIDPVELREAAVPSALLPAQQRVIEELETRLCGAPIVALVGEAGSGKSVVARALASRRDSILFDARDYVKLAGLTPYDRWDERLVELALQGLRRTDLLILDDFMHFTGFSASPRRELHVFRGIAQLRDEVVAEGKQLVLVGRTLIGDIHSDEEDRRLRVQYFYRGAETPIVHLAREGLSLADYVAVATSVLGAERAGLINFSTVRAQASRLTIRQLGLASALLAEEPRPNTRAFMNVLEKHVLRDNVRTDEVEALEFSSLPGSEEIVEALETHVVMPFENPERALQLGIKAKRGVMLFGPPGTGKTAIGRALAHRLKGKFFLIDGSFVTEPPMQFIDRVRSVIDQAKESAPSVLFIDDADNLFTIPHVSGLMRYLLSLLDGLESESGSRVCVMMTVMDARKIPEAMLRSGRVELWLETAAPDEAVRARVLERWAGKGLPDDAPIDFAAIAKLTTRFTPADLRRTLDDARLLHASDIAHKRPVTDATSYLRHAVREIVSVRGRMADTLADDSIRVGQLHEGTQA